MHTIIKLTCLMVLFTDVKSQNGSPIQFSVAGLNPLQNGQVLDKLVTLEPKSTTNITLNTITNTKSFLIIQAHSFRSPIILSENPTLIPKHYVNGTNTGLYHSLPSPNPTFYLFNRNPTNVTVLIAVVVYSSNAPVPGGSNMEFETPIAPYLKLNLTDTVVKVDAQPASLSVKDGNIKYDMYHLYLPEGDYGKEAYFKGVTNLIRLPNIQAFGRKVTEPLYGPELRRVYSTYRGIGHIFTVVATFKNYSSVYVPIATYGCDIDQMDASCEEIISPNIQSILGVIFFLGLFICLKGHKYFITGMFFHAVFCGFLVSFILIIVWGSNSFEENVFNALLVGLAFGLFWISLWKYFGIPILSVSVPNFITGFLFASHIFYCGAADLQIMQSNENFWLIFLTIIFSLSICLPAMEHQANILATSLFGAYCTVMTLSHFSGAYLHYSLVNIIRRAVDPEFQTAVVDTPFQYLDGWLTVSWIVFFVFGYCRQKADQKGKSPFPPQPGFQRVGNFTSNPEHEPLLRGPLVQNNLIITVY